MAKLAFLTFGVQLGPDDDPRVRGFIERIEANFAAAEASQGFIDRSRFDETRGTHTWGEPSNPPQFQADIYTGLTAQTLSLWQDLESVFAFAYHGSHAEALGKRREWFAHPPQWPSYVAWWVEEGDLPTWQEAYQRYDRLQREGPSPLAFNFKQPYGPDGRPCQVDRQAARRIAARQDQKGRQDA
jgi:hypothetical protein